MNDSFKKTLFSTASILTLFLLWQIYAIYVNNPTLMPHPMNVVQTLFKLLRDSDTYIVIFTSLSRLLLSLLMATVLGTLLGLFSGVNKNIEAFLRPFIITIRTLPVISIIVVILIIFGNTTTLYIISLLLLFPIIYQAVLDGVKNVDPLLIDVVRLESEHSNTVVLKNVYFPLSIPFLRSALIEAVGLGFKVMVVAEYIAQTNVSIGREIYVSKVNLAFSDVFAWTILLLLFVLVIEHLVEKIIQKTSSSY
jgi:NitT/TauT family transport system permease protein